MRPKAFSYTPSAADTDAFANDVNASSGNPFTLAATSTTDSLAHKVIITPSGSVTGNYPITGTDADDNAQSETLATNTTNAVTSAKYYKTITSVLAPSGIGANTVDIGWTDVAISKTIPVDHLQDTPSITINTAVTGTINYSVQSSCDDPWVAGTYPAQGTWETSGTITGKTANFTGTYTAHIRSIRLLVNSCSAGATAVMTVIQGGSV
jgi:hypothetical protein